MCMETITQLTPMGQEAFDAGRIMKVVDDQVDLAVMTIWIGMFNVFEGLVKLTFMVGFIVGTFNRQASQSNEEELRTLL